MLPPQITVALMSYVYCCFTLHIVNAALEILKGMAKLANIVREHVIFDMFANNVAEFGHHVGSGVARCKMMVVLYAGTSRKAQCTYCKE